MGLYSQAPETSHRASLLNSLMNKEQQGTASIRTKPYHAEGSVGLGHTESSAQHAEPTSAHLIAQSCFFPSRRGIHLQYYPTDMFT